MLEISNSWLLFLFVLFVLAAFAQILYYAGVFSRFSFYKPKEVYTNNQLPPVSIIIAARNEYKNLEKNLHLFLDQDYPNFEVIVVNDCSWDDSQKLLEYYQEQYSNLKVCQLIEQEKYPTGKKFALTIGIKAASHEHLFFSDADCIPASNQWLRLMQSQFSPNTEIVLGYAPYKKYNSLLNLFIRFESAFTAMAYFSAAIGKHAFMGVGRNLAYNKTLFFKHKGFASHNHILSGDDDLFVNQAATSNNVRVQIDPQSFVYSEPKRNFDDWQRQKSRHNSTGKFYKGRDKAFLGAYYATLLIFYVLFVLLLFTSFDFRLILGVYALRYLVQTVILYGVYKRLKTMSLIWFTPLLDVLYLFYIYVFGTIGLFRKHQKNW
jgi:cellulose synthase/poly-beta-1,6-N-acetylglucosamine synthase-like glycosyltransferase